MRHGFGTQIYADGSFYRGQYKHDKRHGYGEYRDLTSGDIYFGNYAEGRRQGEGKLLKKGQFEYKGGFEEGVMHGEGVLMV